MCVKNQLATKKRAPGAKTYPFLASTDSSTKGLKHTPPPKDRFCPLGWSQFCKKPLGIGVGRGSVPDPNLGAGGLEELGWSFSFWVVGAFPLCSAMLPCLEANLLPTAPSTTTN